MTLDELSRLKQVEPRYDELRAIDKIALEDRLGLRGSSYRRQLFLPLTVFGSIAAPILVYKFAQAGITPPANPPLYFVGMLIGASLGAVSSYIGGTLAYELTAKDGEIGQFFNKKD